MSAVTDTEVKVKGVFALVAAVGKLDAARFIALLNREPFDYYDVAGKTINGLDLQSVSELAMAFRL